MWESFIAWLKGLFSTESIQHEKQTVKGYLENLHTKSVIVGETFNGWIKDVKDERDHVFTGEK